MITFEEIKQTNKDGEYLAIGSDGKRYNATYSAKYRNMFFCIPYTVEVLGYILKEGETK